MSDIVLGWSEGASPKSVPQLSSSSNSRAVRIALLLTAVVILNGVDLAYTLLAHRMESLSDSFNEMNPIADSFIRQDLEPSLICFKILMVLCGTFMLWKVRRSRWTMPACWVLVIAYGSLGVMWYMWMKEVSTGLEMKMAAAEWGRRILQH